MELHGDTERFRLALEQDPGGVGALRALSDAYRQQERWVELGRLYERRSELLVDEPVQLLHCLFSAGELWLERCGDPARASECYRRILVAEPTNRAALRALEQTYRAAGRSRELLELLQQRAADEQTPHRKGELLLAVAELLEHELHRPAEAAAQYRDALAANPFLREPIREAVARLLEERPRDLALLEALEQIQRTLGDLPAVIDLLRRRAEATEEAQPRADLFCDLASLLQEQRAGLEAVLGALRAAAQASPLQPGRIVDGLRTILRAVPGCRPALASLRRIYGDLHRWNEVLDLLEEEVELTRGAESGELVLEMGMIEEERLFRADRALSRYREAVRRAPQLAGRVQQRLRAMLDHEPGIAGPARRVLAEVLAEAEAWPQLEALQLEGARVAPGTRERHDQLLGAARVRLERLGDADGARELFLEVLREDPRREEALRGLEAATSGQPAQAPGQRELEGYYREQERWGELVALLDRRLAATSEPRQQAALHHELGTLWEDRLDRPETAMGHFQTAFRLVPDEERYIEAGARIYRQLRRWPMVVRLLEIEATVVGDPARRAELLLDKARVLRRHLRQPAEACATLLQLLETQPEHEEARRETRSLLSVAEDRELVLAALDEQARQEELSEPAARRLARIAGLFLDEPADPSQSLELLRQAHRLAPEEPGILHQLEQLYRQLGRWPELVDLYQRAAARELDAEQEETYRLQAARVLLDGLDDVPQATRLLRKTLELRPGNVELRDELRDLLAEHGLWAELGELYRWALAAAPDLADPAARRQALLSWTQLALGPMGDPPAAGEPYGLLLALEPTHPEALAFVRDQLTAGRRWAQLISVLDRAWAADPQGSGALLAEAALLAEEQLGDLEGASERWLARLERQPGDVEARVALERLYTRMQRWEPLVGVLLRQAEATPDAAGRTELLRRAVDVARDGAGDLPRAEEILDELLTASPEDSGALESLTEVYEAQGRWQALADNLGRRAALAREMARRADLLRRRASLLGRHLDSAAEALTDLEQVLDLFPDDRAALEQRRELLRQLGRFEELVQVLDRQVALAPTPEAKAALLRQLAEVAELQLRNPTQAAAAWQRVLGLRPSDREALAELDRLHEARQDWPALVIVLQRQLEVAPDSEARLSLLTRLAETYQDRLDDHERAQQAWQQVLELDPDDATAITRLQALFDQRQDWARLAEVLERRVRLEPDPAEAACLLQRLGSLLEGSLARPRQAIQAYEEARERIAGDPDTLRPLRRLLIAQGEFRRAVGTIEEELTTGTAAQGVELCLQAAELWRNQIKEPRGAVQWYRQVLELAPDHLEALRALRTLYKRQGDLPALEQVLESLLRQAREVQERAALLVELAEAAREAGDPGRAFQRLRQAHQLQPEQGEALAALRRLAEAHDLWEPLIEVLQWSMVQCQQVEGKLTLLGQIAQIQEQRLADPGRALATLRFAFGLRPADGPLLAEMERLARQTGQFQPLRDAFELLLRSRRRPAERSEIHLRRARLLEVDQHDVAAAFAELRAAFQLDPADERVRREIEELAERSGDWQPLLEVYDELLAKVENLRAQVGLLQRIARLQEERLANPAVALESLARAFALDPLNAEIEEELNRLGESQQAWTRLVQAYAQVLEGPTEPRVRARFLQRQAALLEGPLADSARAFALYRQAFQADPRGDAAALELNRLAPTVERGWEQVLTLFGETAEQVQPLDLEVSLRRRSLRIVEEVLQQPSRATPHLLRLWRLDEASEDELRRLTQRLREEESWELLLQVHQAVLARTADPARRLARLFQVAHLQEQHFSDPRATLATLQAILQEAPDNVEALQGLARAQQALGNGEAAIAALEQEATRQTDSGRAEELGRRIAGLWDRLGRPDKAARRLLRLIDELPDPAGAVRDLEALYAREESWEDLLELLERLVDRAPTQDQRLDYLARMAQLAWERFDNRKRALRCLSRILEEEPGHAPALARMAAYFREERRWGDLLDVLERQVAHAIDTGPTLELLLEIGTIQEERLFSRRRAVEAFERAVVLAPRDERVLGPLDRLHAELENWGECARVRRLRAQAAAGTPQLGARLLALGEVELLHLDAEQEAASSLRAALESDPSLRGELLSWQDRFTGRARRRALRVLFGVAESSACSAEERARLLCELGRLAEEEGERSVALERYRQALQARPGHLPALAALTALHRGAGDWREVDLYLGRTIRLLGAPRPADGAGAGVHSRTGGPGQPPLAELYLDWAKIALLLNERGVAVARLTHALELDATCRPARRLLADLHFEDGRWEAAESCYRRLLGEAPTTGLAAGNPADRDRAGWSFRLGRCLEATGRPQEAAASFSETLRLDPDHAEAAQRLIPCLQRLQAWEAAARTMERQLSRTPAGPARYELLVELGTVLQERLGRREAALARLEEAHRLDPLEPRALRALLKIRQDAEEPARVVELAGDLAQATADPAEACQLQLLRGRLLLEQLHRHDAAAEAFRRVLELRPADSEAVEWLVRALACRGEWGEQARLLREHIERLDAAGQRVPLAILLQLAQLCRERLGRAEEAAAVLERAAQAHPAAAEVHRARAALLADQPQREREVVEQLERSLALDPGHVQAQHQLFQALLRAGEPGRARAQGEILAFLQLLTPEEAARIEQLGPKPPAGEELELGELLLSSLLADPPLRGPLTQLLDELLGLAPALLLNGASGAGAPPPLVGERLDSKGQHSLALRFVEVQQALGLQPQRALYLVPGGNERAVEPRPGEPPALVVGEALVRGLFRREQRFHLGRGLALTVRPLFLARTLATADGEALLAELRAAPLPAAAPPGEEERRLAWRRALVGLLPSPSLTELARQAGGPGAFAEWQSAVERWATRVGTVVAGDLGVALKALRAETGGERRRALREMEGLLDLVRRSPLARDLLAWIRSPAYPALREALALPATPVPPSATPEAAAIPEPAAPPVSCPRKKAGVQSRTRRLPSGSTTRSSAPGDQTQ